jgi:predicted HNH restriction endonuclease
MKKTIDNYINYGVSSDVAQLLVKKNLPLSTFRVTSKENLIDRYGVEEKIVDFVKSCILRNPIDDEVLDILLEKSNYTCNVCKGIKGNSYIIHHIKEYSKSQDNSYSNLIVLCPNCHDLAHRTGGLTVSVQSFL